MIPDYPGPAVGLSGIPYSGTCLVQQLVNITMYIIIIIL